jgi:hypothetical protein
MKIQLKKNCLLECWSGLNDRLVEFEGGMLFEVVDKGEWYECEDENYGVVMIDKEDCEVLT